MNATIGTISLIFIATAVLSGCGGGGGGSNATPEPPAPPPPVDTQLDWDDGNWDQENWQ